MTAALHSAAAPDPRRDPRGFLRALYDTAVARAQPAEVIADFLPPPPKGRTLVIGAGKAGGAMAAAVDALWPAEAPLSGLVITRYDHVPAAHRARPGRIEVVEAAHPVPDAAGLAATRRLMELTRGLTADDLVLCLISGGGSALLTQPARWGDDGPGGSLTLDDKQRINRALLESGAAIGEMNCVRKHLSAVKGGRLAAMCAPARVVTLLISDVPGDEPAVIASGPTVPDATSCADALAILERYRIDVPAAARAALQDGTLETPKPGDARFAGHEVKLIAAPQASLEAAAALARAHGLEAHILSDEIEGESRVVGALHAALARQVAHRGQPFKAPCVILSGGETTVTVQRREGLKLGRGGRAGEFLLGCAQALAGQPGVHVIAADTDGIDGVEDNAGAIVAPDTLSRARSLGLSVADHLDRHDAYGFFSALGDLVVTGPTFTNVNDFRGVLVC
ncbi:glycerate kinase type-2 family protein [Caldimonas sp. KR1-144]|uniref:glycerate kinase type-2 family protein n=1 Tax=Caldimonas sp. KR1-144 TaxID=3400911 RepID=UPI003C05EADC